MSFYLIAQAIKTKLENITDIKSIVDYPIEINILENNFNFPLAIIVESESENDYLTNKENLITYAFKIFLTKRIDNSLLSTEWNNQRQLVDSVINLFTNIDNITLGGLVQNIIPVPSYPILSEDKANNIFISSYVVLKCQKIQTI